MTVLSVSQIVGAGIAPLSVGGSSSGPSGAGLGGALHDTWQNRAIAKKVDTSKERRKAIAKAKAKIEAKYATKAERLAAEAPVRTTGSEVERASTRGSVTKAAASLDSVPSDKEFSTNEFRKIREVLRQRYQGKSLSSMLAEAAKMEAMLLDDPVQGREALVAAYSRAAPTTAFVEPQHAKGLRGSLQRARQDQQDAEDLAHWTARYGKRLPQILAELEYTDRALRENAAHASAKLAVRFGAPALESEIEPYQARQHQKQVARRADEIGHTVVDALISQGHVPDDEDHLNEVVAVLQDPKFQHDRTDAAKTFWRASQIARHPDHARITPRAAPTAKNDAGRKSISGGPSAGQGARNEKGSGTIRDSVRRVTAAM
jgi:hypothetical protein